MTIGVLILTYNAEKSIYFLLKVLKDCSLHRLLIIDSTSSDRTIEIIHDFNIELIVIPQKEFNHGAIREIGRQKLNTDIVVMLTQDILPLKNNFIENLVAPIVKGEAVVTYARQIAHEGATILEAFPREFNYPTESQIRTLEDVYKFGVYSFFSSDSCAAYLNSALDEIGGFRPTLTWEDYFAVARLLIAGNKVAYTSDSIVRHSHSFTLVEEFRRYFDTGYVRAQNKWLNKYIGQAERRGISYQLELLKKLFKTKPLLIPYAIIQSLFKFMGYRIGYFSLNFPASVNKLLSSQKSYWDSKYYSKCEIDL